jgi:branched-subunit amino acid aminotransferase/4-amino-4-deoxychorismate lyase
MSVNDQKNPVIWFNGEYIEGGAVIPHNDEGYLRGLGVFDTMLGDKGAPINARPHFERLIRDCKTVLLHDYEWALDEFVETATRLLKDNGITQGKARIRTQITAGITPEMLSKPVNPFIMMMAIATDVPAMNAPVKTIIVDEYPRIPNCRFENCKRFDYTRSYYGKQMALAAGAYDALITNTDGNIVCATTSNLFIREGDQLITPPLHDGALNGITRMGVIEKYQATEDSISRARLMRADGVFLTNSILGIRFVESVDGVSLDRSSAMFDDLIQVAAQN